MRLAPEPATASPVTSNVARLITWVALIASVLITGVLVAGPAEAVAAPGPLTWPAGPAPVGTPEFAQPGQVVCPTTSFCAMIDNHRELATTNDPGAASPDWTVRGSGGFGQITGISCAGVALCVMTTDDAEIEISTDLASANPHWTPRRLGYHTVNGGEALTAVSCASTTLCVVVSDEGSIFTSSSDPVGGDWAESYVRGVSDLASISCPSTALCVATEGKRTAHHQVVRWTDPASGPTGALVQTLPSTVISVSCPTTALCVGATPDAPGVVIRSTDPAGNLPTWRQEDVSSTATELQAVSCSSETLCIATDGTGDAIATPDPTDPAPSWTTTLAYAGRGPGGVSCATDDLCLMSTGNSSTSSTNAGAPSPTWTAAPAPHSAPATAVACPSDHLCIGVDAVGELLSSIAPAGGTTAWSRTAIDPAGDAFTSIDCPSTTLCIATQDASIWTSTTPTDPSSWHESTPSNESGLRSISCPSTTFCAISAGDHVLTATDPATGHWIVNRSVGGTGLQTIACASPVLCVAAGTGPGTLAVSTHPATGAFVQTVLADQFAQQITGVRCPSVTLCVASDSMDGLYASTDPAGGTSAWNLVEMVPGLGHDPSPDWWHAPARGWGLTTNNLSCPSAGNCALVVESSGVWRSLTPATSGWAASTSSADEELGPIACSPSGLTCVVASTRGEMVVGTALEESVSTTLPVPTPTPIAAPAPSPGVTAAPSADPVATPEPKPAQGGTTVTGYPRTTSGLPGFAPAPTARPALRLSGGLAMLRGLQIKPTKAGTCPKTATVVWSVGSTSAAATATVHATAAGTCAVTVAKRLPAKLAKAKKLTVTVRGAGLKTTRTTVVATA